MYLRAEGKKGRGHREFPGLVRLVDLSTDEQAEFGNFDILSGLCLRAITCVCCDACIGYARSEESQYGMFCSPCGLKFVFLRVKWRGADALLLVVTRSPVLDANHMLEVARQRGKPFREVTESWERVAPISTSLLSAIREALNEVTTDVYGVIEVEEETWNRVKEMVQKYDGLNAGGAPTGYQSDVVRYNGLNDYVRHLEDGIENLGCDPAGMVVLEDGVVRFYSRQSNTKNSELPIVVRAKEQCSTVLCNLLESERNVPEGDLGCETMPGSAFKLPWIRQDAQIWITLLPEIKTDQGKIRAAVYTFSQLKLSQKDAKRLVAPLAYDGAEWLKATSEDVLRFTSVDANALETLCTTARLAAQNLSVMNHHPRRHNAFSVESTLADAITYKQERSQSKHMGQAEQEKVTQVIQTVLADPADTSYSVLSLRRQLFEVENAMTGLNLRQEMPDELPLLSKSVLWTLPSDMGSDDVLSKVLDALYYVERRMDKPIRTTVNLLAERGYYVRDSQSYPSVPDTSLVTSQLRNLPGECAWEVQSLEYGASLLEESDGQLTFSSTTALPGIIADELIKELRCQLSPS